MTSKITIRTLSAGEQPAWDAYVNASPSGTFFHLSGWRGILQEVIGHRTYYLYAEQDGNIRGLLPLAHNRSLLFGNTLCSTPFCVYGGAIGDDDGVIARLEDHAADLADELRVDSLELRNRERQREGWPGKDLYVTFRKEILADAEANMLAIPRKQRAMVRKGIKAGLISEIDAGIDRFFDIYASSVRDHGTPVFPRKYFEALKSVFGENCEVQTVTLDGQAVSSVMSFYFRNEVLPYYGGGLPLARRVKAFDFMYWEVMRRACDRGLTLFDYGRSKVGTGSYSFKKNWGFTPQPLNYQYHLVRSREIPEVNPLNPKYRLFIALWKRLPIPVANRIGPLLSRSLG